MDCLLADDTHEITSLLKLLKIATIFVNVVCGSLTPYMLGNHAQIQKIMKGGPTLTNFCPCFFS